MARAALVACVARSSRDWQFIQSVGGIAIGTPQRGEGGHVFLPIDCDVSGRAITVKPTAINSGIVCEAPLLRVQAQSVYITICTSLPSERYSDARCPDADLGTLPHD